MGVAYNSTQLHELVLVVAEADIMESMEGGSDVGEVSARHRFDSERLRAYLERELIVFQCARGRLTVQQFK